MGELEFNFILELFFYATVGISNNNRNIIYSVTICARTQKDKKYLV